MNIQKNQKKTVFIIYKKKQRLYKKRQIKKPFMSTDQRKSRASMRVPQQNLDIPMKRSSKRTTSASAHKQIVSQAVGKEVYGKKVEILYAMPDLPRTSDKRRPHSSHPIYQNDCISGKEFRKANFMEKTRLRRRATCKFVEASVTEFRKTLFLNTVSEINSRLTVSADMKKRQTTESLINNKVKERSKSNERQEKQQELLKKHAEKKKAKEQAREVGSKKVESPKSLTKRERVLKPLIEEARDKMGKQQDEVIESVYEQKRTKLRRDLDNLNKEVLRKQETLAMLVEKLNESKKTEVRETEYDKILATQNQDAFVNTTRKYSAKKRQELEAKVKIPVRQQKMNSRLQRTQNLGVSESQGRLSMGSAGGFWQEQELQRAQSQTLKEPKQPSSAQKYKEQVQNDLIQTKVDLDEGIATLEFRPSRLLEEKNQIIAQLKRAKHLFDTEVLEHATLNHMLERLQGQQGYEIAMIRELDPYFNFQDKIHSTLQTVSAGKLQREKIKEQKIKTMKLQLREKKSVMAQTLRTKCLELAELEKDNKKQKSKMIGGGQGGTNASNKDTQSQVGSIRGGGKATSENNKRLTTASQRSAAKAREKEDKRTPAKSRLIDVQDVEEEDEDAQVEVTLKNCLDIDTFLHQSRLMRVFYQTTQKLEGTGDDSDRQVQILNSLKESKRQLFEMMRKKEETIYKLKKDLANKPQKSTVSFQIKEGKKLDKKLKRDALKFPGSQEAKEDQKLTPAQIQRQNILQKYQDKVEEAQQIFYEQKEELEQYLSVPAMMTDNLDLAPVAESTTATKKPGSISVLHFPKKEIALRGQEDDSQAEALNISIKPLVFQGEAQPENSSRNNYKSVIIDQLSDKGKFLSVDQPKGEDAKKEDATAEKMGATPGSEQDVKALEVSSPNKSVASENEDPLGNIHNKERDHYNKYTLMTKIKDNMDAILENYSRVMARDAIMQVDYESLNQNKIDLQNQLEEYEEKLEQEKNNKLMNKKYSINYLTYEENQAEQAKKKIEDLEDERQRIQARDDALLKSILIKNKQRAQELAVASARVSTARRQQLKLGSAHSDAAADIADFIKQDKSKVRQILTKDDLLSKNMIDHYGIEQMKTDHEHFRLLCKDIRQVTDKMRLQFNEATNSFAYRIHCIIDVAEIEYPDAEIEKILNRYQRFWPYEPLDFDPAIIAAKQAGQEVATVQSSAQILKQLAKFEESGKLNEQQNRALIKARKKQIQKGLTDFQIQMMNSSLWIAFQQKIETKLLFLHQKKFVKFLLGQIRELRQPNQIFAALGVGRQNKPQLLKANREMLSVEAFQEEQKNLMTVNFQNMKIINQKEQQDTQTAQQVIELQQLQMQEDKHFDDYYKKNHVIKNQIELNRIAEEQAAKDRKNKYLNKYNTSAVCQPKSTSSGIERILKLVNQDKCNYSRLLSYEMQDTEFIQEFMKRANDLQASELLRIPGQGSQSYGTHDRKPAKHTRSQSTTVSQTLKLKGSPKTQVPLVRKQTKKPPIQLPKKNQLLKQVENKSKAGEGMTKSRSTKSFMSGRNSNLKIPKKLGSRPNSISSLAALTAPKRILQSASSYDRIERELKNKYDRLLIDHYNTKIAPIPSRAAIFNKPNRSKSPTKSRQSSKRPPQVMQTVPIVEQNADLKEIDNDINGMLGLDLQKAGNNTITISQTQKETNTTRQQNTTDDWYITASEEVPPDQQQYYMTQNQYYAANAAAVPGVLVPINENGSEITSQFQNTMAQNMFYHTMGPQGIGANRARPITTQNLVRPPSQYVAPTNFPVTVRNQNLNSGRIGSFQQTQNHFGSTSQSIFQNVTQDDQPRIKIKKVKLQKLSQHKELKKLIRKL